jgi:hypothetical protein
MRDALHLSLERRGARVGKIGAHARHEQVELDDGFLPPPMFAHDVLDDAADERERAVGGFNGEAFHAT